MFKHVIFTRCLLNGGKLIAVHKARYYKAEEGKLNLGPGGFVAALEYACSTKATLIGKPSKEFFLNVVDQFEENASNGKIFMIGDVSKRVFFLRVMLRFWQTQGGWNTKARERPILCFKNFIIHKTLHQLEPLLYVLYEADTNFWNKLSLL